MVKIVYQVSIGVNTLEGYAYFADGRTAERLVGGVGEPPLIITTAVW